MKITSEDIKVIQNNKAIFIGEGGWEKDSAYQIYQIEDRYIAIITYGCSNRWLMYEEAEYIDKDQISHYI